MKKLPQKPSNAKRCFSKPLWLKLYILTALMVMNGTSRRKNGGLKWVLATIWWFLEPYSESSQFSICFESSTVGTLCWECGQFLCGCRGLAQHFRLFFVSGLFDWAYRSGAWITRKLIGYCALKIFKTMRWWVVIFFRKIISDHQNFLEVYVTDPAFSFILDG